LILKEFSVKKMSETKRTKREQLSISNIFVIDRRTLSFPKVMGISSHQTWTKTSNEY
jgi:hypothetical protein